MPDMPKASLQGSYGIHRGPEQSENHCISYQYLASYLVTAARLQPSSWQKIVGMGISRMFAFVNQVLPRRWPYVSGMVKWFD